MSPTEVDLEYERRVAAMTPKEKIARSAAMFEWTRQQLAARIAGARPNLSAEQIRWEVALELYASEPEVVALIREYLADVSR